MAACWPLQMSAPQKAVLISLADQANDEGVCWPSVGTISKRTCLSERAVQDAIAWLQKTGMLYREYRQNKSTYYTITPSHFKPENAPAKRVRKNVGADGAGGAPDAGGADGAPGGAGGAPVGAGGAPLVVQVAHPNHQGTATEPPVEPLQPALPPAPVANKSRTAPSDADSETALQAACRQTWKAYAEAYSARYGALPVRNATINAKVKQFVQRIGYDESPAVAAFFVSNVNEAFVVRKFHEVGLLLNGAETYRTQWATGQSMTSARARQVDKSQSNYDAASEAMAILRKSRGGSNAE